MFSQSIRSLMDRGKLLLVAGNTTVREAAEVMKAKQYGAVLVMEDDHVKGIFTERDAVFRVIAAGLDPDTTEVRKVMTKAPTTIGPDKTFGHAMLVMHENGFRHLPVVENDKLVGMVSSRNALDPSLEEFVFEERRRKHLLETR
jgi:CBS domain-containing protein